MKQTYTKRLGMSLVMALIAVFSLPLAKAQGNGNTYSGTLTGNFVNAIVTPPDGRGDVPYTLNWSATWNTDGKVTISVTIDTTADGIVAPQLWINNASQGAFTGEKPTWSFTTASTYQLNDTPGFNVFFECAGANAMIPLDYTVGSSNSTGGGDDSGNTGGGNTGGDQTVEGNGNTYSGTLTGNFVNAIVTPPDGRGDVPYTLNWSATWNTDGKVTISVTIDTTADGIVAPQLWINNASQGAFTGEKPTWSFTTASTYQLNDTPGFNVFFECAGSNAMIPLDYTVGSSNSTGGGNDSGNTGGEEGDGGDEGDDTPDDDVTGEPGATYSGKPVEGTIVGGDYEGQKVTVAWTATWNEDQTVTFTITVNPSNFAGLVPQLFIDNAHAGNFESANGEWTYTTTQKYEAGETPTLAFYITVANGATEQIPFDYTVGAEGNDSGSSTPPGTNPDDDNTDDNVGNGATATGSVKGIFENAQLPGDETVMDIDYTLEWTGTWNEDGTVTITLDINPWVVGLVPQLNVNGVYYDDFKMVNDDNTKYTITTTDTYKEGTTPFSLYMPYTGGTDTILLDYEVGASGDSTGVQNIGNALRNDGVYYDLSGRPVANPKHGIFIINGKKVVIR